MGSDLGWKEKLLTLFGGVARGMKNPRDYQEGSDKPTRSIYFVLVER